MGNRCLLAAVAVFLLFACSNQNKEDLLAIGISQFQTGNIRGAVVYLRQALELDPNYFEARYHLGEAYLKTGQYRDAEQEFEKVKRQNPAFPDLFLKLAEVYRRTDRFAPALESLKEHHLNNTPTADSLDLLGVVQSLMHDYPAAAETFRQAAELSPDNPLPVFHLAQSHLGQSDKQNGIKVLNQILETFPKFSPAYELLAEVYLSENRVDEAITLYRRLFDLDPSNVSSLYMRGLLLLTLERTEEARSVIAVFEQRFPEEYRGLQLRGIASYKNGKYDDALVFLRQSLKSKPHNVTFYYIGLSHFQQHEYELAINQYQRILDHQPDSVQARLMLAMTFLLQKRVNDCLQQIRYVLNLDPRNGLAHNILGSAYLLTNKYDDALQAFNRAIDVDPDLIELHLKKSQTHTLRGEADMAEHELVTALLKAPQVLNTRLMLASHHVRQQRYADAVSVLKEGLTGASSDALIFGFLASVAGKQENHQAAVSYLQQAQTADPSYRTPYFELANYYIAQGDSEKAVNEYNALLTLNPHDIRALVELGLTYELQDRETLAVTTFEKLSLVERPEASLEYARYLLRMDESALALDSLNHGLTLDPDHPDLLLAKAGILLKQGLNSGSATVLEQLNAVMPGMRTRLVVNHLLNRNEYKEARRLAQDVGQNPAATMDDILLLVSVLEAEGKLEQARALIERGLASQPHAAGLMLESALLLEKSGAETQAIDAYQELIRVHPDDFRSHFALGALYDRLGNKPGARSRYREAIVLRDTFVPALNNLAYLTVMEGGSSFESLSLALRAYRLSPDEPVVLDTLGLALRINGRLKESAHALERARSESGGNPTICYHLALTYIDLKRIDLAKKELESALQKDGFPEAAQCRELLSRISS